MTPFIEEHIQYPKEPISNYLSPHEMIKYHIKLNNQMSSQPIGPITPSLLIYIWVAIGTN